MPDNPLQPSFWENEANELWAVMIGVFVDTLMDGIAGGVNALPSNVSILTDMDVVNQAAIAYARQYRYEWISKITETTRTQTQALISEWIQSGQPLSSLETQLAPVFGSVRAQMIASTEVTRVFAEANQSAWDSTGMISGKVWMTSKDDLVCPICKPMSGVEVGLKNSFPNALGGGYKNPPAHPRCRCWLQPILDVNLVIEQSRKLLDLT